MKIKFLSGLMAALTLATTVISCDDDNKYEYHTNNDCAITAATMGTLVRSIQRKDSIGRDTTIYVSVTGSLYPMSIDQERNLIYNVDSLPVGTDIRKVTFSTINSLGALSIRSLQTGNDTIFSTADSTDFSVPRTFTVHSSDGISKRNYLMTVNVHKESADSMVWHKVAKNTAAFQHLQNTRSFAVDGKLLLFGYNEGISQILTADAEAYNDGGTAQWITANTQPAVRPQSIVRYEDAFYAIGTEGKLLSSSDGTSWESVNTEFTATTLVAAGSQHLVALKDGKFYSSTDALTWTLDKSDMPEYLPETVATGVRIPSNIDKNFETLVVVGTNQGKNVVWKREIDLTGAETYPWVYIPESLSSQYNIPNIQQVTLNIYDGVTLMSGLTADNQLAPLYMSRDNGRTWKTNIIKTPQGQANNALAVTVDKDNFIWMFCGNSGEVWRGRINRLGWDLPQGSFERSVHLER